MAHSMLQICATYDFVLIKCETVLTENILLLVTVCDHLS